MAFFNGFGGAPEEGGSGKGRQLRTFATSLLILVLFFFLFQGSLVSPVTIDLTGETMTLSGTGEYAVTLPYAEIVSIALTDSLDLGEMVDGTSDNNGSSGVWQNSQWGEYSLFTGAKMTRYIVVAREDGSVVVFNYENDSSTELFYTSLRDMLEGYGYSQIAYSSFQDAA